MKCDEANMNCDKSQYADASLWEKIKLNIHLIYCRACRKYSSKNSKLTKLLKSKDIKIMEPASKSNLKDAFENELSNN